MDHDLEVLTNKPFPLLSCFRSVLSWEQKANCLIRDGQKQKNSLFSRIFYSTTGNNAKQESKHTCEEVQCAVNESKVGEGKV